MSPDNSCAANHISLQPRAKILVIRWKCIGDVVFALPAVNLLRDSLPNSHLTFWVSKENAFVTRLFDAIDDHWTLDRGALRTRRWPSGIAQLLKLLIKVRSERFDAVVDLQGYGETSLIVGWSGAKHRWASLQGGLRRHAYTHVEPASSHHHPAEQHLKLLHSVGFAPGRVRNHCQSTSQDLAKASEFLFNRGIRSDQLLIYVQPLTSSPARNWPLDRYKAIMLNLEKCGCRVLVGGGPADMDKYRSAGIPARNLTNKLDRTTDIALLQMAHLVIGGDTGFVHLALAMGTRVLVLRPPHGLPPFQRPDWAIVSPGPQIESLDISTVEMQVDRAIKDLTSNLTSFRSQ
jgi:ADP-heptose:LPS heptosyltransferase